MSHGLLDLSTWQLVLAILLLTHVTIAAVTIFLHRAQAHRAVELHPVVSHFFRAWLWLTTGMVTREWVAIHRKHHVACETEEDPHSPQTHGIHTLLWRGAELYRGAAEDRAMLERYGRGTPDDWLERHVYGVHPNWGVGTMLVIDVALFGPIGLTVWAVQMLWIPVTAAGVIKPINLHDGHFSPLRKLVLEPLGGSLVGPPMEEGNLVVIGARRLEKIVHGVGFLSERCRDLANRSQGWFTQGSYGSFIPGQPYGHLASAAVSPGIIRDGHEVLVRSSEIFLVWLELISLRPARDHLHTSEKSRLELCLKGGIIRDQKVSDVTFFVVRPFGAEDKGAPFQSDLPLIGTNIFVRYHASNRHRQTQADDIAGTP